MPRQSRPSSARLQAPPLPPARPPPRHPLSPTLSPSRSLLALYLSFSFFLLPPSLSPTLSLSLAHLSRHEAAIGFFLDVGSEGSAQNVCGIGHDTDASAIGDVTIIAQYGGWSVVGVHPQEPTVGDTVGT